MSLQYFRRGHVCNTWLQWIHILRQLVDGFGRILDFTTWLRSVLLLVGHARRQLRQWLVFYWSCWSSCTSAAFPTIAGRKWPRSSSFLAVACSGIDWLGLLVTMHFALCSLACRPSVVEEKVAALVVVSGSGLCFPGFAGLDASGAKFPTFAGRKLPCSSSIMAVVCVILVLRVFMHLGCVPDDCRQVQLWLLPQIMEIVKVIRDVDQIVASCREIVEVSCCCDVEQILASCHRSLEIVEVTAGAAPAVVDVLVI